MSFSLVSHRLTKSVPTDNVRIRREMSLAYESFSQVKRVVFSKAAFEVVVNPALPTRSNNWRDIKAIRSQGQSTCTVPTLCWQFLRAMARNESPFVESNESAVVEETRAARRERELDRGNRTQDLVGGRGEENAAHVHLRAKKVACLTSEYPPYPFYANILAT